MKSIENLTVSDYVAIARRRFWYIVLGTLLGMAGTVAYVLQMNPVYMSETTIVMAGRLVPDNVVESIIRESNQERLEFVRQQLQSRTFLERIIQEFQLSGPTDNIDTAMENIRERINTTPINSSAFKLSFRAPDANLAQAVTRRLAERVIQMNDSGRKEKVYGTDQFIDEQLRQAAESLNSVEQRLSQFYSLNFPGVPRDGINVATLTDLQAQLSKADSSLIDLTEARRGLERRKEEQRQLATVAKAAPPPPPAATPNPIAANVPAPAPTPLEQALSAKRLELANASTRYTDLHPEVTRLTQEVKDLQALVDQAPKSRPAAQPAANPAPQRPAVVLPEVGSGDLLQAELDVELDRIRKEIAVAEQTKRQVASRVALYQARINPPAHLAQELSTLNREYDTAKQQYQVLSNKRVSSGLASEADTNEENQSFKIVDEANLPKTPPARADA